MRHYIGPHRVMSSQDLVELALGTPPELWLGVADETEEERSARLDAARDILAEDPGLIDRLTARAAHALEVHPCDVLRVIALPVPTPRPTGRRRRAAASRAV